MIIAVLLLNKGTIKENVTEPGELVLWINTFQFDGELVNKAIEKCTEIVEGERKYRLKLERKRSRSRSRTRIRSKSVSNSSETSSGSGSGSDTRGSYGLSLKSPTRSGGSSGGKLWKGLKKATSKAIETVSSPKSVLTRRKSGPILIRRKSGPI